MPEYKRVYAKMTKPSMTKQSFKDECNINKIMARFEKTGAIDHYAKYAPTYGDASPLELMDAQQIIINAETMFSELPSNIRKRFHNSPEEFLEFVQDESNIVEMRKLGLAKSEAPPEPPIPETPPTPPETPTES